MLSICQTLNPATEAGLSLNREYFLSQYRKTRKPQFAALASYVRKEIIYEMKSFETLFEELTEKARRNDINSGTVKALAAGKHSIGKKLVEEAAEIWMAAEYEGREKTAEEISQLLYHIQVMMLACDLGLEDIYRYL